MSESKIFIDGGRGVGVSDDLQSVGLERDAMDRGAKLLAAYLKAHAREANTLGGLMLLKEAFIGELGEFAEYVAKHEREECAKLCDYYDEQATFMAAQDIRDRSNLALKGKSGE